MSHAPALSPAAVLRESALAGLLAIGLALPLVGIRLKETTGAGLGLEYRFTWVIGAGVAVFVGRALAAILRDRLPPLRRPRAASKTVPTVVFSWMLVAFGFALPFTPFADRYIIDVGTSALIYVMLGLGLNVVVGLAGLLDLGYVAFYAVGAYAFALLSTQHAFSFWLCLPIAAVLAAFLGVLLGFPVLRLRGDYLAIVTLGFGEIIRILLINAQSFTGGPNGISGIPRPTFFGHPFTRTSTDGRTPFHELFGLEFSPLQRLIFLYYVILSLVLLTALLSDRLRRLPIGRAWEALREDEVACRSLGLNPTAVKMSAFAIGASFGGLAGTFFAARQGFVSPESFTFIESALILAIVVLGGMGSQIGIALAAIVVVALPEFAREFAEFRMLVFGAAMVAIMLWRPRGLVGTRTPSVLYAKVAR
jgi:branched-chain amino acid transport system permease protein